MKRFFSILILTLLILPQGIFASSFDPAFILSDNDLLNADSMNIDQIQSFLEYHDSYLATYKTENWEGDKMLASEIIWNASQDHGVSAKFLLVLLQKEQSLIKDQAPTDSQLDWATGYAVCDSCSKDDPSIQRWKGFGKQVNSASLQYIEGYMADIEAAGVTQGIYGPGVEVEVDGEIIVPLNAATAAMYAYTPHLHGNENFYKIWQDWFGTLYPNGSILQPEGEAGIFIIENGEKRPVHSWSAFLSRYNPDHIITVDPAHLASYPEGRSIDLPNYSLLISESGDIYLLVDDALRQIDSMETFRSIGFSEDELREITDEDIALYDIGEPITMATINPTGSLLQLSTTDTIFYVQNGERHIVLDPIIATELFGEQAIEIVAPSIVEQYRESTPLLLPDGYLIKSPSDPSVYFISEGKKRLITSEQAFLSYGWNWHNILTVNESIIGKYENGETIDAVDYSTES